MTAKHTLAKHRCTCFWNCVDEHSLPQTTQSTAPMSSCVDWLLNCAWKTMIFSVEIRNAKLTSGEEIDWMWTSRLLRVCSSRFMAAWRSSFSYRPQNMSASVWHAGMPRVRTAWMLAIVSRSYFSASQSFWWWTWSSCFDCYLIHHFQVGKQDRSCAAWVAVWCSHQPPVEPPAMHSHVKITQSMHKLQAHTHRCSIWSSTKQTKPNNHHTYMKFIINSTFEHEGRAQDMVDVNVWCRTANDEDADALKVSSIK